MLDDRSIHHLAHHRAHRMAHRMAHLTSHLGERGTVSVPRKLFAAAILVPVLALAPLAAAHAQQLAYTLDPEHTFPSFEADHMGWSFWRGKFNRSTGTLALDRKAGKGEFTAKVDLSSLDFGHDKLNSHMTGPDFFDIAKHPEAVYRGKLAGFVKGVPKKAVGELTLHGVTRPLELKIDRFKCGISPIIKKEVCGANLVGQFDRSQYGLDFGRDKGFAMKVVLRIQAEAVRD